MDRGGCRPEKAKRSVRRIMATPTMIREAAVATLAYRLVSWLPIPA